MKVAILLSMLFLAGFSGSYNQGKDEKKDYTSSFDLESHTFETTGSNRYFILQPGYQLQLEGIEGRDTTRLIITVLNETRKIAGIETRVVEERESENGRLIEVSRNYFAFCKEISGIFYFGEDVDIYRDGKVVGHSGAWLAEGENRPGLMMPGLPLLGSRYYQEIAPNIAMDRAEITGLSGIFETPAGKFSQVLSTLETTPLEPLDKSVKLYAPGIGLIKDDHLVLVKYGYPD